MSSAKQDGTQNWLMGRFDDLRVWWPAEGLEFCFWAQAATPSLAMDSQQLEGHVLTSVAAEALGKNMQREDQLIFALLHTFWEVRPWFTWFTIPHATRSRTCTGPKYLCQ